MASADPQLGVDSSAAVPSLPVCCRNKFLLFISKLLEGVVVLEEVVLGIGRDTFLERGILSLLAGDVTHPEMQALHSVIDKVLQGLSVP